MNLIGVQCLAQGGYANLKGRTIEGPSRDCSALEGLVGNSGMGQRDSSGTNSLLQY